MPSNTPLPAAEFMALCDKTVESLVSAIQFLSEDERELVESYRAARASSPRTLEEVALARVASAIHDHREEQRHESDARRVAEDAIDDLIEYWIESFERGDNARRLDGEGGGK